jgi:hypothetical protein
MTPSPSLFFTATKLFSSKDLPYGIEIVVLSPRDTLTSSFSFTRALRVFISSTAIPAYTPNIILFFTPGCSTSNISAFILSK